MLKNKPEKFSWYILRELTWHDLLHLLSSKLFVLPQTARATLEEVKD